MTPSKMSDTELQQSPRLGCAVVIINNNRILLGKRGKKPNYGKWVLPGGKVNFLEPIRSTAKREILEETGLEIRIDKIIGVYEIINPPDEHRIIAYWWAYCMGGKISPSSDLLDAKFFSMKEVKALVRDNLSTPIVTKVLQDIDWA